VNFLTARWSHLCLLNYPVPRRLLERRLPPGLTLDLHEGEAWVSLVAFDFLDTRVLGIHWPGYRDFPEINLRFYVRHGEDRGVVFVRELVPLRLVAWIARVLYDEPYVRVPMQSAVTRAAGTVTVHHQIEVGGRPHSLEVTADDEPWTPDPGGPEHHFKEHTYGYGADRRGRLRRYVVEHPVWRCFPVRSHALDWDFGAVYGEEWAFLDDTPPASVLLAEGSAISVSPRDA